MNSKRKGIAILGSTGSIGTSALDLIDRLETPEGSGGFRIVALAANKSVERLAEQVRKYEPLIACVGTSDFAGRLRELTRGTKTRIVDGKAGLRSVATLPEADFVLAGIVGAAGLDSTYAAVEAGKVVGLANKEALVCAGSLINRTAAETGAVLIPVDSEHNALHQCLRGETIGEVRRLVLTASGGPFRGTDRDLASVTPDEALAHPTWVMGPKITIDSATLMNKALEIIEAHWLFGVAPRDISVVIHPQSTIHSMVEFVDGSFVCQLGATDMRHPIQYALTYPDRCPTPLEPVRPETLGPLSFEEPDLTRFPCLEFGWRALEAAGTMPAVLNAANEVAVQAFLDRTVRFTDIPGVIEAVMRAHDPSEAESLDIIHQADAWARQAAGERVSALSAAADRSGGRACPTP